ncbi:MAG: amino acid ABC transporter permease [Bauldia sp.]|nr:MAG: amino acid ABC transporter permease [Bauldia sp.]
MALRDEARGTVVRDRARTSIFYDPRFRAIVSQAAVVAGLVLLVVWIVDNTIANLQRANIASGFDFLSTRAGFDISQSLIAYSPERSYARAFLVGLLNTLLVAAIGIVVATIIGFLVGIARLSRNWIVARIAAVYVETLRNIPVLLQLLFWYRAVLSILPGPRQAIDLPLGGSLSNRGLLLPSPVLSEGFFATPIAFAAAVLAAIAVAVWARRRQMATGQPFPTLWTNLAIIVVGTLVVFLATGAPLSFEFPELKGFNFVGGLHVLPEFLALLLGLSLYTATYIAEIVRAGILAVAPGQTEAAFALGLRPGVTMRRVVVPQAMRVIIPPLTSQYLNLTKNSSLAVAVAYPDLVLVFAGTVLNQTGQAVEVIFITMLVYLAISLATSAFMNWFNRRVALVER